MSEKCSLRSILLEKRRSLSTDERDLAQQNSVNCIKGLSIYRESKHVGVYQHSAYEVPTDSLITLNTLENKLTYLPIITSTHNSQMRFAQISSETRFKKNSLGVSEPIIAESELHAALKLDLLFLPLVGFDNDCNRLGMGKGYYDRFLEHRLKSSDFTPPFLIGLAFTEQHADVIPTNQWDVPLDAVVTSNGKIIWKPSS